MRVKKIEDVFSELSVKLVNLYPTEEIKSITYILLEHYLEMNKAGILLNKTENIDTGVINDIRGACNKLAEGKPIQYVIGETEFFGRIFKVNSNVLIPRPETEELVEWIVKDYQNKSVKILDIGTGSGAIAVSLACELQDAELTSLDVSPKALDVAKTNADLHYRTLKFIEADILSSDLNLKQKFDVIVSNPPYVMNLEKKFMRQNVLEHEPHLALFVEDNDPLIFYKAIAIFAMAHLKKDGCIYFEINESLGQETSDILHNLFNNVELKKDLSGKDRMIKAYGVNF